MQYSVLNIQTSFAESFMQDVLVSELSELGFDSFLTEQNPLQAFIQSSQLNIQDVEHCLRTFPYKGILSYTIELCEDKDWNAEWEQHYFTPIVVGNKCVIHSSFAKDIPQCQYNITIDPKMAFGTGHHQTTSLMLESLLEADLLGRSFLDMGCGTAVLAILATMRGAQPVTAVDIDDACTRNAKENIIVNNTPDIEILLGDARVLEGRHFDFIVANINRNILLNDMSCYAQCLNSGGQLLLSGFYTQDVAMLLEEAERCSLNFVSQHEKDNWCLLRLCKL